MKKNLRIRSGGFPYSTRQVSARLLKSALLWAVFLGGLLGINGQALAQTTTITTAGTGFDASNGLSGNSFITFVIENNNTYDIILTGVDNYWKTGNNGTVPTLWYTSSSLSGAFASPAPGIATPTWTNIMTGAPLAVTTDGFMPSFTNLNFVIPAGVQYRFALQSTAGISYSGSGAGTPNPNTFTTGGVTLKVHDAKIATLDVGFSGAFPNTTNGPRSFTGRIHFMPATPCVAPPTGGQATASVTTVCPNTNFQLGLTGASGGQGMTYQWQSSPNGTTGWTNVTGATNANVTVTQTATTFYRAQLTCSGQPASSLPVQVTTNAVPTSGTFTINKNGTPSATVFTSFAAAIASIECGGVNGPVIFNVLAGSGPYLEQVTIPVIPGASVTNTITFNGNGNTLRGTSTAGAPVIKLDGADYIRVNNLTIETEATATAGQVVHLTNGADNNIFNNNTIKHTTTSTATSYAVYIYTGSNNNNTFSNNTITGAYYGIYNYGASGTVHNGNQFTGNTIKDQYAYGIYNYYVTNTLIEGNDISRPTRTAVTTMYGITLSTESIGTSISKNRIHNSHDAATSLTGTVYGIYLTSADATVGNENVVKNNLIYNINNTGTIYGIYSVGSDGNHNFHNTIVLNNAANTGTIRAFYQTTEATNVKFQNNIVVVDGGTTGTKHALYFGTNTSDIISNNNVLYVNPTASNYHIGYFSANQTTLAAWTTASSQDTRSMAANPVFTNPATGDFTPTSTAINGIGASLTPPVTTDITGASRNIAAPDPGAYEFLPTAIDAGIAGIISPTSPVQPGVNQPIQVTLKNFGLSPLTSATITATITGTATQTITFNWTGTLANNATANVNIGNFTFPTGSYTINVCSSMPNGVTDPNTGNDCFSMPIISCSALAGAYTIDKNNPTAGTNFTSFNDAVQRLTNCGITGPVTFNVVAGTGPYNEQVVFRMISGASATNTVTFNGNGNTLSANPAGTYLGAVTFDGAKFVTVNNFVITLDAAATAGWGVQFLNAADNNTISNNTINMPTNSTSTNFLGIGTGATYSTYGNHTNNSKIQNNIINGGYYGIRMNGTSATVTSAGNQITGNQVKDAYYYGIYLYYTGTMLIEGNDITRLGRTDNTTFYSLYNGYSMSNIISKNQIHGIGVTAIYGIYNYYGDSPTGAEAIIKNNLIYDFNNTGTTYAIYSASADGSYFFHNTVDLRNTANTGTVYGFYQTTAATNMKFQNNIISIDGGVSGTKYAMYYGVTTSVITSNNNVINATGTANVGYYSAARATLAAWQTASSQDANSVAANPQFVTPASGDFHPSNGAVNNIGAPVGVTDDIIGVTRSMTTPDPGAYEFSVNPIDVGVTAITGVSSGCGLTATQTVTITVRNFGSASQSNIPVSFTLSGSATGSGTGSVPGPIAPYQTATYVFTTKANMAAPGPYTLMATTSLTGDADATNDSFTINVANSLIPTLPIALDFETPTTGIGAVQVVTNPKSTIVEATGGAKTGAKGMIMAGITSTNWQTPVGVIDPWTNNGDQFSAIKMCINPTSGPALDSLFLIFDLKQLFKTAAANTNFRVTVNGTQVGPTYNPPFSGTPIVWKTIRVDLTPYKNLSNVEIALESSVKEEYAGGAGTANLIDNVILSRRTTGLKSDILQSQISVYPNPSTGIFNVTAPKGNYTVEVTDMTGKTVLKQTAAGATSQLNLQKAAKGIYLLKITSEGSVATQRLVIQ